MAHTTVTISGIALLLEDTLHNTAWLQQQILFMKVEENHMRTINQGCVRSRSTTEDEWWTGWRHSSASFAVVDQYGLALALM